MPGLWQVPDLAKLTNCQRFTKQNNKWNLEKKLQTKFIRFFVSDYIYHAVALLIHAVSSTVELLVVAERVVCVESTDVVAGVSRVAGWAVSVARALLEMVADIAGRRDVVVATTGQEVTTEQRTTAWRVVHRRVVDVAFSVDEILAPSRRVVTTATHNS